MGVAESLCHKKRDLSKYCLLVCLSVLLLYNYVLAAAEVPPGEPADKVAAVVDNRVITLSEIELTQALKEIFSPSNPTPPLAYQVNSFVEDFLIERQAARFQIENASATEVKENLKIFDKHFTTPAERKAFLLRFGLEEEDVRLFVTARILREKFIQRKITMLINISSKEVEDYYLAHRGTYGERRLDIALQEEIRSRLFQEKYSHRYAAWLKELKEQARIRIIVE